MLYSFNLDILDNAEKDAAIGVRNGKKIGTNVSFFKLGVCSERTLICAVKSSSLSASIKLLEPVGLGGNKLKGKFGRLFKSTNDSLRIYKVEISIENYRNFTSQLNPDQYIFCEQNFALAAARGLKLSMSIH